MKNTAPRQKAFSAPNPKNLPSIKLPSIHPSDVTAYLQTSGWIEFESVDNQASMWRARKETGERFELRLPWDKRNPDYLSRMAEVVERLQEFTGHSREQVLTDFALANLDIVRVRDASAANGTVPLRQGMELIHHSFQMMLAAASAATAPGPIFYSRKPDQALAYLDTVRLGQTEREGFVLTLLCPVPPLAWSRNAISTSKSGEPYQRVVTRTLARALEHIRQATRSLKSRVSTEDLQELMGAGVSVNLCDALIGLHKSSGESQVDVSFAWSRGRPAPSDVPSSIVLPKQAISYVEEIAQGLKKIGPLENVEVQGLVIKLSRVGVSARSGEITISGFIDGVPRQVKVKLPIADYQKAVIAHEKYRPVSCFGLLNRDGNYFRLRSPQNFQVISLKDFDAGAFRSRVMVARRIDTLTGSLFD